MNNEAKKEPKKGFLDSGWGFFLIMLVVAFVGAFIIK